MIKGINKGMNTSNYIILAIFVIFITFIYLYRHKIFMINNKKESFTLIDDEVVFDKTISTQKIRIEETKKKYSPIVFENGIGLKLLIRFDMFINSINESEGWSDTFDSYKPIFKFGDSIYIIYNPKSSNLKVQIKYRNSSYYDQWWDIDKEILQQKWNNIVVEINGRRSNLFINNKLIKSIVGPNVPLLTQNPKEYILIGGDNFQGKLKKMVIEYN